MPPQDETLDRIFGLLCDTLLTLSVESGMGRGVVLVETDACG